SFIGRPSQFVGFRNFVNLWDSDIFRQTFQNAFVFTGIAVVLKAGLGIALALLLNEQLWWKRMMARRLYRTGESEYLLNGNVCRLRDIQDLFAGTGVNPK